MAASSAAGTVAGVAASAAGVVQDAAASAVAAVAGVIGDVKAAVIGEAETPADGAKDGKKKEKKAKPAKVQPVKEVPTGPMPSMIDLRVGKVLDGTLSPSARLEVSLQSSQETSRG